MTSKISCFDGAIFRRSLRKTLPLWVCYALCWLFLLPGGILSVEYSPAVSDSPAGDLCQWILNYCTAGACLSALIGLLAAWFLFSWLFHASEAYFYASLPVRRETLFLTNYALGLTMVTAANLLTALVAFLATLAKGYAQLSACLSFFGVTTLAFVGFYGFAVFLSIIIGQAAVMPAVYVILSFTSVVLYSAVNDQLASFVYGMSSNWSFYENSLFTKLSPVYYLLASGLSISPVTLPDGTFDTARYFLSDWGYPAALALCGAVFAVLALLLLRRREMERSGDVIAVRQLRPVFLYSFTVGCALVFSYFLSFTQSSLYGAAAFRRTLLYLLLGAFLGYFIAQMLLSKSVGVFRVKRVWLGFGAVCLAMALCCAAARYDIFGLFRRVPEADEIASVDLMYCGEVTDEATFEELTQFQRLAIARRKENEAAVRSDWTSAFFTYRLKDGTVLSYQYRLAAGAAEVADSDSLYSRFEAILNSDEMILAREAIPEEFCQSADSFAYCSIVAYTVTDGSVPPQSRYLSAAEAYDFYQNAILPDLKDGSLGRFYLMDAPESHTDSGWVSVTFVTNPSEEGIDAYTARTSPNGIGALSTSFDYTVTKDAARSAAYLESLGYSFELLPLG